MRSRTPQSQDTIEGRMAALAAVPYLARLEEADLRALARESRRILVGAGESVFQEGEPCLGLHIIAKGRIKVSKLSAEGREQILHAEPKGALGEAPLFDGEPYPASALALEPSVLLFLPRQTVLAWCRKRPDVAIGIAGALARRMRRFAALAEGLSLHEVSHRLAGYLVRRAAEEGWTVQNGVEILLTESNQEIAAQIGTVREMVSRMLASLRRDGLIAVTGRRITILDAKRLRAHSGPS